MPRAPDAPFDDTTTPVESKPPHPPLAVVLRIDGAPATPIEFTLRRGECIVGSSKTANISIADRTISRHHVSLTLVPEGIAVRDLQSRNGTFYLGQRIESMVLGVGGRLVLGTNVTLSIRTDEATLHSGAPFEHEAYRGILGTSAVMRRLFGVLSRLEGSLVTVLVEGESGVGKEAVARALHDGSQVREGPFVAVNCGAIARDLVASELFGHRRGAFTGAHEGRKGAFEAAHGGTLLLDELTELPLDVQPMLLRVLETSEVQAVGDDHPRPVKVRIIAATNRDIEEQVRAGTFREDLFYRLAVVRLRVPPLRERPEDIRILATYFAEKERLRELPRATLDELQTRPLPGNVRELRNLVQAYAALGLLPSATAPSADLRRLALTQSVEMKRPYLEQRDELVDEFTRIYLDALLARTGGNQTAAARLAGLDRTYLGRLLSKYRR